MPLNTKWTRSQLRSAVRRELMDSSGRWWTDTELNTYLDDWQRQLQEECEFTWTTNTATVGTATYTLPSDCLRPDALYWDGTRVPITSRKELDTNEPNWRNAESGTPRAYMSTIPGTIVLWPSPSTAGTVVMEYPTRSTDFATDTSTMVSPAWTKYSAIPFVAWKAYARFGPNQDHERSLRRRAQWRKQLDKIKRVWAGFFPYHFPSLRPSGKYEARILRP